MPKTQKRDGLGNTKRTVAKATQATGKIKAAADKLKGVMRKGVAKKPVSPKAAAPVKKPAAKSPAFVMTSGAPKSEILRYLAELAADTAPDEAEENAWREVYRNIDAERPHRPLFKGMY
jgi:hypothetical protein